MIKSNTYKKAILCRNVVEDLLNEDGIDLFVFDDLKKIINPKASIHPNIIEKVVKFIWNETDKLTSEAKQAISFFAFEERINQKCLSFVMPPNGMVTNEDGEEEFIETSYNWDMIFETYDSDEVLKAISYVWGTAGLDLFECSDDDRFQDYDFKCDLFSPLSGNPLADSGRRSRPEMWTEGKFFNEHSTFFNRYTTSSIVPYE